MLWECALGSKPRVNTRVNFMTNTFALDSSQTPSQVGEAELGSRSYATVEITQPLLGLGGLFCAGCMSFY